MRLVEKVHLLKQIGGRLNSHSVYFSHIERLLKDNIRRIEIEIVTIEANELIDSSSKVEILKYLNRRLMDYKPITLEFERIKRDLKDTANTFLTLFDGDLSTFVEKAIIKKEHLVGYKVHTLY